MICNFCNTDFEPAHFNSKLCSDKCRILSRSASKASYKKSEKGAASEAKWVSSEKRKNNEKGYRQKPRSKALAVIRSTRSLSLSPILQEKKRARDAEFSITEKGKTINKVARKRYMQTPKGKISRINAKARRRQLEGDGKITAKEWAGKLEEHNYTCNGCGAEENIEMDHIIPLSKGGKHHVDNTQPLCRSCNASKGDRLEWVS